MIKNLKEKMNMSQQSIYTYLLYGVALTVFIMFTLFKYIDFEVMTVWTINFWDCLFDGSLMDFFEYTIENARGITPTRCRGNYLWLIPWCVWNFPVWLYCVITGTVKVTAFWMFYWSKIYILLLTIVIIVYICKIANSIIALTTEEKKLMALLIAISPELLMSTMYAGQDEVLYLSLYVVALYYFLEEKIKRAYICAALSAVFCPQMLLPFLVLLMIREKSVIKIGSILIGTVAPLIVFEFIYRNNTIYIDNKLDLLGMMHNMLGKTSVILSEASILGIIIVAVLFFCYVIEFKWDEEGKKNILYINALIFCAINVYAEDHFYRLFTYVPFLILIIMLNKNNIKMNMFLLLCLTYARTYIACKTSGQQNMNTVSVFSDSWYASLAEKLGSTTYGEYIGLYKVMFEGRQITATIDLFVNIIAFAAMLLLLYINFPKNFNRKYDIEIPEKVSVAAYAICMPFILGCYMLVLLVF